MSCVICGNKTLLKKFRNYFCGVCYKKYKQEILGNAEWIRFLINNEQRERKYYRQVKQVSLDDYDLDTEGTIYVRRTNG